MTSDSYSPQKLAAERTTPHIIRREGNHLRDQKSLYLLQHAHNPVDWYPWGEEALAKAFTEDKPLFVSVGYSSCHWCHVMEQEVFEDDAVAIFLNSHFVNMKIDREERPDLDRVFMNAVLALTGNGGWPMSVFLTPEQKPFFGGTYYPRDQFIALITRIIDVYRERRADIETQADRLYQHISREPNIRPGALREQTFSVPIDTAKRNFDENWGGFQTSMKFPMPGGWQFLLHYYRKSGDEELGRMVRTTLDHMGSGGLQDHVSGGFHRYTTEPTWLVPHFEKMLYDNAQLASLYLEASAVFDEPRYSEIARDTLDFLIREMSDPRGGFYSSFDADSGGREGSYYLWTPEEIQAVAGPRDGPALAALLGVEPGGNFEGKSILTRRVAPAKIAERFGLGKSQAAGLFSKYRTSLLVARSRRVAPCLDRKIITSWNGLVISALARAYALFDEESYRLAAEKTADFLMKVHRRPDGGLYRSSTDGVTGPDAILDDYSFLALGLLDLYQATGELWQLKRALKLIGYAQKNFRHAEAAYYLTAEGQPTPLGRQVEISDGVRPSGNSAMLQALQAAAELTGNQDFHNQVESDLDAYANLMQRAGMEMAGWLDVALKYQGPYYQAVVSGNPGDKSYRALLDEFDRLSPSHAVLARLPASGPTAETTKLLPGTAGKHALQGKPTAFVCHMGTCKQPTHDPREFGRQLMQGWKR